jgi:hypothetical protein
MVNRYVLYYKCKTLQRIIKNIKLPKYPYIIQIQIDDILLNYKIITRYIMKLYKNTQSCFKYKTIKIKYSRIIYDRLPKNSLNEIIDIIHTKFIVYFNDLKDLLIFNTPINSNLRKINNVHRIINVLNITLHYMSIL